MGFKSVTVYVKSLAGETLSKRLQDGSTSIVLATDESDFAHLGSPKQGALRPKSASTALSSMAPSISAEVSRDTL